MGEQEAPRIAKIGKEFILARSRVGSLLVKSAFDGYSWYSAAPCRGLSGGTRVGGQRRSARTVLLSGDRPRPHSGPADGIESCDSAIRRGCRIVSLHPRGVSARVTNRSEMIVRCLAVARPPLAVGWDFPYPSLRLVHRFENGPVWIPRGGQPCRPPRLMSLGLRVV